MDNYLYKELKRLRFEDIIWLIFAFLCLFNIYGDELQIKYLYTNENTYQKNSNNIFIFTIFITFFIYLYFFLRNYNNYKDASIETKTLFTVKTFGSAFLIGGILCLLYFQMNNQNFIGTPGI
jgi:hypothetical protein